MKYFLIDCTECAPQCVSDIKYPVCRECVMSKLEGDISKWDVIIFKNRTFTKQYYPKDNTYSMYPFFVDCMFKPVHGKLLKAYDLKDAKVRIIQSEEAVEPVYSLYIPGLYFKFGELWKIYQQYEKRDLSHPLLQTWIKEHGILSYVLTDPRILEININPPAFETPFRILHANFDECMTNIYPTPEFLNYLATYMKMETGRPLNKAQPQLDGEIAVGEHRGRVAAVIPPFSVFGTGYSIRKHREHPWTVPLFMDNHTVNKWYAGVLSLAITHGRAFMVAGPRGSGKTSLLGSLVLEILPKYRIITIEDTQELPIESYKSLKYDLLPMKVRSALLEHGMELPYDIGLRTTLRLGDSCLIVGEIRSKEARVLYEAMRVGAMSNVVAGTIHADNPYGVFDRVVNDLGVPRGSFKATDFIVIVNQIKSPTGLGRVRRVMKVTEVLKEWEEEPVFQDLLVYNSEKDELEPTSELLDGKSELIKRILANTRGYKDYNDLLDDIKLRGWAKEELVKRAGERKDALEAEGVTKLNLKFAQLFEDVKPLESEANYSEFQKRFDSVLRELLTQYIK
jgi:flagellar protein FlaI